MDALRPAAGDQVANATILVREHCLELGDGHLVDWFWTLDGPPSCGRILS
jgi:hypothetical protein